MIETIIQFITIISFLLILHVYLGYPAILWLLSKVLKGKPVQRSEAHEPSVTLMISCYNEIDVVDAKIRNALALDYPKEKINIVWLKRDLRSQDHAALHRAEVEKIELAIDNIEISDITPWDIRYFISKERSKVSSIENSEFSYTCAIFLRFLETDLSQYACQRKAQHTHHSYQAIFL